LHKLLETNLSLRYERKQLPRGARLGIAVEGRNSWYSLPLIDHWLALTSADGKVIIAPLNDFNPSFGELTDYPTQGVRYFVARTKECSLTPAWQGLVQDFSYPPN
jgi:hypothetical protein